MTKISTLDRTQRISLLGLVDHLPLSLERDITMAADEAMAPRLAKANTYAFATVDYPGAAYSQALDSNGTITVGGFAFDLAVSRFAAFTYANGVYEMLGVPNSTSSFCAGINAGGVIVGVYEDLAAKTHGFVYNAGAFTDIDVAGAVSTQAIGINDGGDIVGTYADSTTSHGFVYSGGAYTTIDFPGATATFATGINTGGDVVGMYSNGTSTRGFALRAGTFTQIDFPLQPYTTVWGINDSDEISGYYTDSANVNHGFVFAGGAYSQVDVAGAKGTLLARIKNGGEVVGACYVALGGQQGIIGS